MKQELITVSSFDYKNATFNVRYDDKLQALIVTHGKFFIEVYADSALGYVSEASGSVWGPLRSYGDTLREALLESCDYVVDALNEPRPKHKANVHDMQEKMREFANKPTWNNITDTLMQTSSTATNSGLNVTISYSGESRNSMTSASQALHGAW